MLGKANIKVPAQGAKKLSKGGRGEVALNPGWPAQQVALCPQAWLRAGGTICAAGGCPSPGQEDFGSNNSLKVSKPQHMPEFLFE